MTELTVELEIPFYNMEKEDVIDQFQSTSSGLTDLEVRERQVKHGKNVLREGKKDTILDIFINQFKDFLVLILIIAVFISGFVLDDLADAILISIILILNAILGVYQEWRADQALEALKQMVAHTCVVLRDGQEIEIPSEDLVPGDIIVLLQGNRIPADGRIIEANNLRTDEAQLTGESTEVLKSSISVVPRNSPLGDRKNSIYMGTHVTFGKGKAIVTSIGMNTEIGKIAIEVQTITKDPTPTQVKLEEFGKKLSIIIIGIVVFMVFYGVIIADLELHFMFEIAVSLAVAAIPESLVIVITLALSLGVMRMAKQNAIIKKLPAVESLGSVTVICTDKTGTLTLNKMTAEKIVNFTEMGIKVQSPLDLRNTISGEYNTIKSKFTNAFFLCNNSVLTSENVIGDPLELALLSLSDSIGIDRISDLENFQRIDEIPFDSERKRMTVVVENLQTKNKIAFTKGAPEVLLNLAKSIDFGSGPIPLTDDIRVNIQNEIDNLADKALRVLGFGYFEMKTDSYNIVEFDSKLVLNGLVGMRDPPKKGVKEAVSACFTAGIKVIMVTGDHKKTAVAIGKEIGIYQDGSEVMDGANLDEITDNDLQSRIQNISIFARISPQHKLRIVKTLKSRGEIVAMTGDGVNDAPALKGADIGIAMGSGTDVTKETAELILEDDNFTTIVDAIEEGRGIYDNMTKFIRYMLSSNLAEIIVIFLSIIITQNPALVATQILWINLVTDGVPALALGADPTSKDIMKRPPRHPKENLLARDRVLHIFLFGGFMSIVTLGSYLLFLDPTFFLYDQSLNYSEAQIKASTIAFAILSISQFAHALNVREDTASILGSRFFKNKFLIISVLLTLILQVFVIQGDAILSSILNNEINIMHDLFRTVPLGYGDWLWVTIISSSLILYSEGLKLIKRNTRFKQIC